MGFVVGRGDWGLVLRLTPPSLALERGGIRRSARYKWRDNSIEVKQLQIKPVYLERRSVRSDSCRGSRRHQPGERPEGEARHREY